MVSLWRYRKHAIGCRDRKCGIWRKSGEVDVCTGEKRNDMATER